MTNIQAIIREERYRKKGRLWSKVKISACMLINVEAVPIKACLLMSNLK